MFDTRQSIGAEHYGSSATFELVILEGAVVGFGAGLLTVISALIAWL